ncbi:hypothetical protein C7447_102315 [Tenacibaculum adriaticum]|uniref:Uncharacterized protein n=1 Tax=Tenacibaculum adriaticum TaxID=413713 RepID=A0A5S5DSY9_9FLAO|nr:hypothetical protein [Tenacibaculum adriaticum]TYP98997.1 hypothetical protein C7447_102315 [Tenacibaculum adriaticum]
MENFRQRPKGEYTWEAAWSQLYVLTEHWKSDLQFYKDDLRFLHHLINRYFIWMIRKDNVTDVRKIIKNLHELDLQCSELLKHVNTHLSHLGALIEDPFKYDSHEFRKEHGKLEDNITEFVKAFRKNRKETFHITEHVIESEKLGYLLNHQI